MTDASRSSNQKVKHPIQPLQTDDHGVVRFKPNAIVQHLLDHGGIDLNKIAVMDFTQDDREQFAQLIGYSLSGFAELSYVSDETYVAAQKQPDESALQARYDALLERLESVRTGMRDAVAALYGIHPDDLESSHG